MKDIILIGAGGCMREIAWQIQEQNKEKSSWNIVGYVDCEPPTSGEGLTVGTQHIPYLGDDNFLMEKQENVDVAICVGSPNLRKKIAEKLKQNPCIQFPNLILGNTRICEDVKMGCGCMVSMDTSISTNVKLGDFVFLNIGTLVCHDGCIGDFVTLSPEVKLAGNVRIGAGGDIGIGTKVIQGVTIGENVVAGAGAVIVGDIEPDCTIVGVPAKKK